MEKYIGKYSVKDFLYLILGAFIYSIGTHSFIETANIAPGGAVGVALMLNHVTNLPVGRLTLMVNVPLLILAWFHLSRAFALRTAFACGICSVVLDYVIAPVFPVYMGDQLMGSLYGGILVGVGMAVVTTASFKIMSNWFRAGIYARLVSIFMATGGLGTFFAAAPLAALNTAFGWRPVFRGIAVFSLFWGALLWLMVKDAPSRGRERTPALSSMQRPACIRSGCAHPPGVSAEDRHKRAPESSTSPADILRTFRILFSSPQYRLIVLWYLTGASLFFSFAGLWAGDYYRRVHGLSAESLGALLSLGSLSLILGTPAGAWLSDRLHSRRAVLIIGSVCALGSSLSLCFSSAPLPLWALWLQFGGICVAGNATASAVFASAREVLPPSVLGLSTSMLSLSIFGCTACLQAVIGGLLETFSALGPEQAYAHAFSVYLVFASVSLAAALMFRPSGHQA